MIKYNSEALQHIDGSMGEGGGSILRVATGIACALNSPLSIINIRKNRKIPGLRLQHLIGIQTMAELTSGETNNIRVKSTEVDFTPGKSWNEHVNIRIATAGNIGLLCQTLHNSMIFAPSKNYSFDILGGATYGKFAPGIEFLRNITYKILNDLGYKVEIKIEKHGYYPKGGAQAKIQITPNFEHYSGFLKDERTELIGITGIAHIEEKLQKPKVGERIYNSIKSNLTTPVEMKFESQYHKSLSTGVGVDCWLEFSNGTIIGIDTTLGERGLSSEKLGRLVAKKIQTKINDKDTLDEYTADQILPFLYMIEKPSIFKLSKITSHFRTNFDLCAKIFDRNTSIKKLSDEYLIKLN
jgi:RNA 3'-terminal phosphate cyclase (ATP)